MKADPEFYDSQAQAAAELRIALDILRDAKRNGCPAFRSGRVYRAPFLAWLAGKRAPAPMPLDAAKLGEWNRRIEKLFAIFEVLDHAHEDGEIDFKTYGKLCIATLSLVLKLGEAWNARIDELGYRNTRRDILAQAALAESASLKRSGK